MNLMECATPSDSIMETAGQFLSEYAVMISFILGFLVWRRGSEDHGFAQPQMSSESSAAGLEGAFELETY